MPSGEPKPLPFDGTTRTVKVDVADATNTPTGGPEAYVSLSDAVLVVTHDSVGSKVYPYLTLPTGKTLDAVMDSFDGDITSEFSRIGNTANWVCGWDSMDGRMLVVKMKEPA